MLERAARPCEVEPMEITGDVIHVGHSERHALSELIGIAEASLVQVIRSRRVLACRRPTLLDSIGGIHVCRDDRAAPRREPRRQGLLADSEAEALAVVTDAAHPIKRVHDKRAFPDLAVHVVGILTDCSGQMAVPGRFHLRLCAQHRHRHFARVVLVRHTDTIL